MRFYIAADSADSGRAQDAAAVLERNGHERTGAAREKPGFRSMTAEKLNELAFGKTRAVRDAELVLVMFPGGDAVHAELGAAIATRSNKRIILWSETGDEFRPGDCACPYYFHPSLERLVCPFDALLDILDTDRIDTMLDGRG